MHELLNILHNWEFSNFRNVSGAAEKIDWNSKKETGAIAGNSSELKIKKKSYVLKL